jgi:rubredoxin
MQNIEAGILFDDLPEQYCCSVCGAEKKSFAILKEYK